MWAVRLMSLAELAEIGIHVLPEALVELIKVGEASVMLMLLTRTSSGRVIATRITTRFGFFKHTSLVANLHAFEIGTKSFQRFGEIRRFVIKSVGFFFGIFVTSSIGPKIFIVFVSLLRRSAIFVLIRICKFAKKFRN